MKSLSICFAALVVMAGGAIGALGQVPTDSASTTAAPSTSQASASIGDSPVRVYPAPEGEPLSTRFTVNVENQNAPVYLAKVNMVVDPDHPEKQQGGEAGFASFDMGSNSVSVTVTCPDLVQTAKILPTSSGVIPAVNGHTVTFTVSHPEQLTVEVNGDWNNSLHLFADPMETDVPDPNDPNVIYFGPGIHQVDTIQVGSGKTVYLAGGAIVYGKPEARPIFSAVGSNITFRGRGIIDGSLIPKPPGGTLIYARGKNIEVEGLILRDAGAWTLTFNQSDGVKVRNVKEFGWRLNSDGIDINCSRNVEVSDCFERVFDDLIDVKTVSKGGESRDITVKRCVLWNQRAHALSMASEVRDDIENVTFSDCDVIHDKGHDWLLGIFDSDGGTVKNVVFDDIRIEEVRGLISLWIGKNQESKDEERGHIENITFSNITSPAPEAKHPAATLVGFDADHAIHGVNFDHVMAEGRPLELKDVDQNQFVDGVALQPQTGN